MSARTDIDVIRAGIDCDSGDDTSQNNAHDALNRLISRNIQLEAALHETPCSCDRREGHRNYHICARCAALGDTTND